MGKRFRMRLIAALDQSLARCAGQYSSAQLRHVTPARLHVLALVSAMSLCQPPSAAAQQTSPNGGTVAGVIRDTLGRPMPNAEIMIPDIVRSTRSDAEGKFQLADIARGEHYIWIRSLGYQAAQFRWESTAGARIDIAVKLIPLPNTLDAVTVYAAEERNMKSRSKIVGVLVDTAGNPIEGAELQLVGAARTTYSDATGAFVFRNVPHGDLTVRARQMGYAPATKNITLLQDDERQVFLKMSSLAQMLDERSITAESGYGPHQDVWAELDKRLRFRQALGSSKILGPERLAEAGKEPLDYLIHEVAGGSYREVSIRADAVSIKNPMAVAGDACILENGWKPMRWPLRAFGAEQLDMLEYYPATPPGPETEHTQTIVYRMESVPGCGRNDLGGHPAYYVLWFKGPKEK